VHLVGFIIREKITFNVYTKREGSKSFKQTQDLYTAVRNGRTCPHAYLYTSNLTKSAAQEMGLTVLANLDTGFSWFPWV
jgi:hypothetical protein